MIREDEILYKIDVIIRYLKEHKGYDSNIVEYAEDVLDIVKEIFKVGNNYKYEKDYYLLALKGVIGSIDDVLAEVHFLKDIYTEEEIHSKLIEEIDKEC